MGEIQVDLPATPFVQGSSDPPWNAATANSWLTILKRLCSKAIRNAAGFIFDADTVSGYGIGTASKNMESGDPDALTVNGFYFFNGSQATGKVPFTSVAWEILHIQSPASPNNANQIAFCYSSTIFSMYIRSKDTTWDASWSKIWNTSSDGNGGQPPAPKPTSKINFSSIGQWGIHASATTPNISGAVFAVIVCNSSGQIVGADGQVGANEDVTVYWPSATNMLCWRTI